MLPYILCYSTSCLFTKLASDYKLKNRRKAYVILSAIAVIIPCMLAALRDSSVGTDVEVYGDTFFSRALTMDFFDFVTHQEESYLYMVVVYICAHTVGTLQFQYFVLQALSIVPFYIVLQRDDTVRYSWFGLLIYYLMFFPYSLNLMKQSIAVAITFWGFKFVQERRFFKYVITIIIAVLFHYTAFIGLFVYPVYILVHSTMKRDLVSADNNEAEKPSRKSKSAISRFVNKYGQIISWLIIGITVIVLTQVGRLVTFLYQYNLTEYEYFYNKMSIANGINIYFLLLLAPIFIMYLINRKYYERTSADMRPLFVLSLMGVILYEATAISSETYRISLYFYIFLPIFAKKLVAYKSRKDRNLWIVLLILVMALFSWFFFVHRSWCGIYPYVLR